MSNVDYAKIAKEKTDELKNKVLDLAKNFENSPETLAEYLKFQKNFHQYSARNTMLIFKQNPDAFFCNSYKAFKDKGYSVKKGEHGMKVLVPTIKTFLHIGDELIPLSQATPGQKKAYKSGQLEADEKLYFKVGTVFDITQTDCPKEDYPKYLDLGYSSEHHAEIFQILKSYCENELNCPVYENSYNSVARRGYYSPSVNEIHISGMFDDSTKLSILSHELAHAMMHNGDVKRPEMQIEFEADAVSVMLHHHLNLEVTESRKSHLSSAYKEMTLLKDYKPEMLTQSLDRANNTFKQITETLSNEFQVEMEQNNTQTQQPILPNQIPDMDFGFTQTM